MRPEVRKWFAERTTVGEDWSRRHLVGAKDGSRVSVVLPARDEAALQEYRGNRRRAAEVLGIGERTLYRKIKAYRLE